MGPAVIAHERGRRFRPSLGLLALAVWIGGVAASTSNAELLPTASWEPPVEKPVQEGGKPKNDPAVQPPDAPEEEPQRPRRRAGGKRRPRDTEADRAALRTLPLSRAKELIASAGEAFAEDNHSKALRRSTNALTILEGHVGKDGVRELEFDAKWIALRSRFQQKGDVKLAEEFRALDTSYPGRLAFEDHWQTGVDLAFTEEWKESHRLLVDAAEKFTDRAERLKSFAAFVESVRAADAAYTGEAPPIDPGYESFLERSRPDHPDELFEYALRTSGMKVWDKTLIALRDARMRLADDPNADPKRLYLITFNEVRTWISIGAYETAAAEFERLVTSHGDRIDWISWLQVGKDLVDRGAREPARRILEAGKARFKDHAARFDREIAKL